MSRIAMRAIAAAAIMTALTQAGGEPARAQDAWSGARYTAIARDAEAVLLLDQQQGIIYHCPITYRSTCYERSRVGG
jgi:hypothetical protein